MPLYIENYKIDYAESQSYQDFHQSCPQNKVNKKDYKKILTDIYFDIPVNYCPYLIFEVNKRVKNKLKTNCFQIELEFQCMYENQSFNISITSKKGPLELENVYFEIEKYVNKLNLNNPIVCVEISIIESAKKLKLVTAKNENKYNVFTSVQYKPVSDDIYLGLVKLDLETKM